MEHQNNLALVYFLVFLFLIIVLRLRKIKTALLNEEEDQPAEIVDPVPRRSLIYKGSDFNFVDDEIIAILEKYSFYYRQLGTEKKQKFLSRLKHFISKKNFIIHDEDGYKEMPILICAAAIQISLGLEEYILPHFSHIHIFPEEFIGISPTFRFLQGNVSGHCIHLSWKHFLHDIKNISDGENVGLHEMAHAYYYQNFETRENVSKEFVNKFEGFNLYGDKILKKELEPGNELYSDYGLRNMYEFWAESIELFFEKPAALKYKYPELYDTIKNILKQDPLEKSA